jgi:CubicO group peptidase (beta-lactamase class C family)
VYGPRTFFEAGGGLGGGLVSTAGDYARFGQMLLNGGELDGVRIVSRKTVEYMTSDHSEGIKITMPQWESGYGWGLGVVVRTEDKGLPALHSDGSYFWFGYAGTQWIADPDENLQILCFTNFIPGFPQLERSYWLDCERIVYQALE